MKYGMRERISGAVILLALAVIFIPMLFDEPPSHEEQLTPVLSIEQPIEVAREPVAEPAPPASLGQIQMPQQRDVQTEAPITVEPPSTNEAQQRPESTTVEPEAARRVAEPETRSDPIAELAARQSQPPPQQGDQPSQAKSAPGANSGDWAVQVGSFGKPDNAERLESDLKDQGFNAFRQIRSNDLTTVYVGPFGSSDAGEKARAELKQKANIQGLLVRLEEEG